MHKSINSADYLQRFSPKVLWHFTGYDKNDDESFKILKTIIKERKLKIGEEQTVILMSNGKKRMGLKCSCMCDIPFKDLRIHTSRYGKYGIAFDKISAIKNGYFNPVLYIDKNHPFFKITEKSLSSLDSMTKLYPIGKILNDHLWMLGTYVKRSDLTKAIDIGNPKTDQSQDNNFYYEREWRTYKDWSFNNEDNGVHIKIGVSTMKTLKRSWSREKI